MALLLFAMLAGFMPPTIRTAAAAPSIATVDLGLLGGTESIANDINDAGQIVGSYRRSDNLRRAYVWQNGVTTPLNASGRYANAEALAINALGQAAGISYSSKGNAATLWRDNKPVDLDPQLTSGFYLAVDLNANGQVVGNGDTPKLINPQAARPMLWQNGTTTDLGAPQSEYSVKAINDAGHIVGHTSTNDPANNSFTSGAFVWRNGTFTMLATPPATRYADAHDINTNGDIVGRYVPNDGRGETPVVWRNGVMSELPLPAGWTLARANAINDREQIVGQAYDTATNLHALLWQNGQMVDLGNSTVALGINNVGQIVGYRMGGPGYADQAQHATMWLVDPTANLVGNPGFEIDSNRDNAPDIWSANALATRSSAAKRSGGYSLRLQSSANRDAGVWQAAYGVRGGASYAVEGWVNIPATTDQFGFSIAVAWKDGNGQQLSVDTVKSWSGATGGWNRGNKTLTAPVGAEQAIVRLNTTNLGATVYVDDVVLQAD